MTKPRERLCSLVVLVVSVHALSALRAENIDPASNGSQYAYGENVGWLNSEPLGDGGSGLQVDDFEVTGYMWGENIGWINLSRTPPDASGVVNSRVFNNGAGVLSGYAWAENVGWVNFAPTGAGVSIDPVTGDFSGRAWAENVGWITFASAAPVPYKVSSGWTCVPAPAAPAGIPSLTVGKFGTDAVLSWTVAAGATGHDVVHGDLGLLRNSGGNFATATQSCVTNNRAPQSVRTSGTPVPDAGFWFLVRGVNCGGSGTYDSGAASQVGSRDAEINASASSCP